MNQRDPGQPLGSAGSLLPGLAARIPAAPQGPRGAAGQAPRGRAWGRVSRGQGHTAAGPRLRPSRWPLCSPELRGPGLLATGTCFYSVAWDFVASDGGGPPASSRRPAGLPGEAGSPGTWAWLTKPPAVRLTAGPLAASSTQAGLSLTGAPEHVAARCWLATPAPLTRARARRFLSPRSAA